MKTISAKSGIDASQLSEEDYNKAIAQLKNETEKIIKRIQTSLRPKTNRQRRLCDVPKKAMAIIS